MLFGITQDPAGDAKTLDQTVAKDENHDGVEWLDEFNKHVGIDEFNEHVGMVEVVEERALAVDLPWNKEVEISWKCVSDIHLR
jgi:hypothetical protein